MQLNSQNILNSLQTDKLPTLPHVLVDALNACQSSESSFQDLAEIISRDASISARVVSMANSSFFNLGNTIRTLDRALLVLGTETIKTIVITAIVHQFFSGMSTSNQQFQKAFWRRSLNCALLAKSLAILTSYPRPDEAYLCGLLHNVGELVFCSNYPEEYNALLDTFPDENIRLKQELGELGVDHAELGALLIERWGLSAFAVDAVRFHHANLPDVLGAHHLTKILYMSSSVSVQPTIAPELKAEIGLALFELNPSLVNEITRKIDDEVYEVAQSIGINLDNDAKQARDTDAANIQLAKAVRDQNMQGIAQSLVGRCTTKNEFAAQLQHTMALLFGVRSTALFWCTGDELNLIDPQIDNECALSFKLDPTTSLVAKASIKNTTVSSFEQDDALVADQQILRMLNAPAMLCIPLSENKHPIAVIVASLQSSKEQIHPKFLSLLTTQLSEQAKRIEQSSTPTEHNIELSAINAKVREIAHEANNPLSIINNYLSSLSTKLTGQEEVQEELSVLREELDRASQIILRLRDIQQDERVADESTDINLEIKNLLTLYKSSLFLAKQIEYEYKLDSELQAISISRNSLRQILTNLMKNAVEALPDNGRIIITSAANINVNGAAYAEIIVRDNGPGIPMRLQKDLFTPVATSKGSNHSGLGLSITKNLVTELRGTITCRSDRKGTQFQILLPQQ